MPKRFRSSFRRRPRFGGMYNRYKKRSMFKRGGGAQFSVRMSRIPAYAYAAPRLREFKRYDTNLGVLQITPQNSFLPQSLLNPVVQGSSFFQRIGNKISMKSLKIRGHVTPSPAGIWDSTNNVLTGDYLRWFVIYDRQPNGVAPLIQDVLRDTNNATTVITNQSGINPLNRDRFLILRDQTFSTNNFVNITVGTVPVSQAIAIGPQGLGQEGKGDFTVDDFIKLKGLETVYNVNNAGGIGDIQTGSLFFFITTDLGGAKYQIDCQFQLRYYDA